MDKHQEAIGSLEQEDAALKYDLLEAMLSDDVSTERSLKQRRKQIATEIEQHHKDIRSLRDARDNLKDTSEQAANLAAQLDMLNFGYAFGFGSQLRDVLVHNELALKARQSAVKRELPKYSQDVYSEIRSDLDDEYAAKQQRDGMSVVEYENFQKRKAEQERKNEAATREYVGVGAFGGKRRSEPDNRDFSN